MARRRHIGVLLLALALGLGSVRHAAADVADYLGRPVTQVRLEAEGVELRERAVLALVETRLGQPLNMAQVRETIGHLFGLGRYEDVQVRASLTGGGVALVYELMPIHHVRGLEFRGRLELDESLLRDAITERLGTTPRIGRAAEAARLVEDLYRDYGYRRATVKWSPQVEHDPDRTTLIFEVAPGARTRVGNVTVEGSTLEADAFLDRIGLRPGMPYERPRLDAALAEYRDDLQARRYYEARVSALPVFSADESTADVRVTVAPGPLIDLRFEGDLLPEEERDKLVPIARERSVDEDFLEDSKLRIERWLRDQGHRDARADYRPDRTDDLVTIVFTIARGPQYRLAGIEITGSSMMAQLRAMVRLKETAPFVDSILTADVAGMGETYRRRGYAGVKVDLTTTTADGGRAGERLVTARIAVSEGVPSRIGEVTFDGNRAIDQSTLRTVASLTTGQAFYAPQVNLASEALALEYLNHGYQNAAVQTALISSDDGRTVDVAFRISEGVQVIVDQILIVGNTRTKTEIIENELVLKPGDPLGRNAVIESQRRLGALGLFRRYQITELRHPGEEARRDLLVTVEEATANTIAFGGGPEGGKYLRSSEGGTGPAEERIEIGAHGFFQIGRRNLWGKNRSINLFAGVSFRPKGARRANTPTNVSDEGYGFNEYRVRLAYREPRILGSPADGQLTAYFEQGIRSSFNFSRRGTSLEAARRLTGRTSLIGRYSLDRTSLFDRQHDPLQEPVIDRLFPQVRLSSFASSLIRDTREDQIDPALGTFATIDAAVAARAIGSEVGFVKTLVKGFFYRQLSPSRRVVFAGGATLGLADGLPRDVTAADGVTRVDDLPASERFYAGGDTTVRGFALDRLGTPETIDEDGFPKGGHALVIFNAELRIPVWRDVGAVGFIDIGNVFDKASAIDLSELRSGIGFGLRYRSPVGPIRVDLGFKLSRLEVPRKESLTALHISLGQAF